MPKLHEWDVRYYNLKQHGGISAVVKKALPGLEAEGWEVFSIFTPTEELLGAVLRRPKKPA